MSGHRARKRFGQHFLADPGVIGEIVHAIRPTRDDLIVEIGPGLGAITRPLAARAGALHLIELDRDLAAMLRRRFAGVDRVTVHEADALDFDFSSIGNSLRVVGNLPYNISTPLLFQLVAQRRVIADMHFMLQKEVVDRMTAAPGSKAYGRLTIMLGCHMQVEALFDVAPGSFDPPPAVMSAVARLEPLAGRPYDISDQALLERIVRQAFSQRRKTVRNALKTLLDDDDLAAAGIEPELRPEAIGIGQYVALSNLLAAGGHDGRR